MTIIKNTEIPYLKKEVIEFYNNVTVVSADGGCIKMNSLILCAASQFLKIAFHEEGDDCTIITEFSFEELKQMKEYYIKGSCDITAESILKSFGLLQEAKIKPQIDENEIDHLETSKENTSYSINVLNQEPVTAPKISTKNIDSKIGHYNSDYSESNSAFKKYLGKFSQSAIEIFENSLIKEETIDEMDFDLEYSSDDDMAEKKPIKKAKIMKKLSDIEENNSNIISRKSRLSMEDLALYQTFELPKSLEEYIVKPRKNTNYFCRTNKEAIIKDLKKTNQCNLCDKKCSKKSDLTQHVIKNHNEHFSCSFCHTGYLTKDAEEFKKHIFMHICGKLFIKNDHRYKSAICIQCGLKTSKKHLKNSGPFHNDECSQCLKKMPSYQAYLEHVRNEHSGVWKYR